MSGRVIVDGYFASGKSSVASILARRLGVPVIRPFNDDTAPELFGYIGQGDFARLDERARAILRAAEDAAPESAVFDRHWLSIAAYLPEAFRDGWATEPQTYLCWADLDTTVGRLIARAPHEPDRAAHGHFVNAYRALADERNIPIVDTSHRAPDEAAEVILEDLARTTR